MTDVKVKGHPDLRRRGAGVVNVDMEAFHNAQKRLKSSKRLEKLETDVANLGEKMDLILELLREKNNVANTSANQRRSTD